MKKKVLWTLILVLTACMLLLAVGCVTTDNSSTGEKAPKSLLVTQKHEGNYIIGEDIDLSEIKFVVKYTDKSTETVTLTDIMISEKDREKFFVVGVHTVTISYLGLTTPLQIAVSEKEETSVFKATFFSLGGTDVEAIRTDVISAFPVPERDGYIFDGWYVGINFSDINSDTTFSGNRAREPYTLTQDTSFYAKWLDKRTCTVTFVCDADIMLPMPADWNTRTEEERLHLGDVLVSYTRDENDAIVSQTVSRQGRGLVTLPVDRILWEERNPVDLMQPGDTVARFQQDKENNYIGMLVTRKDAVLSDHSVHYGEKFDVDGYSLPSEDADGHSIFIEGKKFIEWNVTNGNANKVTIDLLVRASFQTEKCTVSIYYFNSNNEEINVDHTYDYGTLFAYGSYTMPTKEGYTTSWVVYYNHSKKYVCPNCGYTETTDHLNNTLCKACSEADMQETGFEKMPDESGSIILTKEYTLIQPYHVINTYDIVIQNGVPEQTQEALRSGNIQMEYVYEDSNAKKYFSVDWNTSFDYTLYTQDPKLNTPAVISDGYSSQWCYVIRDANDKQVWYNGKGQIWSDAEEAFMEPERPEGEAENYWILRDAQGDYIATIRSGIATEIKGSVNLYAKYLKKDRVVNLRREYESVRGVMVRLTIPFYDSFSMYDPASYAEPSRYAFSPDRLQESDPAPDPIIRDKLAVYEQVRVYELYLAKQRYETLKSMIATYSFSEEKQKDFVKFFVWMSLNAEDMALMNSLCASGGGSGTYDVVRLQTAVENYFGTRVYFSDAFTGIFTAYQTMIDNYGDLYTIAQRDVLISFYNQYAALLKGYGLGYEGDIFARDISFDDFDLDDCRLAYLYYHDTAGYKFYYRQFDRSAENMLNFVHAKNYRYDYLGLYLSDTITYAQYAVYERYRSVYEQYRYNSGYLYYCAGLEGQESDDMRLIRLCITSKESIANFYYYTDTNLSLQRMADFYNVAAGEEDWSIEWYKTAEMNVAGKVNFVNEVITVIDDTNLYCKDIDNRRYELTFYYDYDFVTGTYNEVEVFECAGVEEVVLSDNYSSGVLRTKNGVVLSYDFIGWYDVSYHEYLVTGYRGNGLRLTSSHTENVTYYAHYSCVTTYTIKISDTTQSMAYSGLDKYSDGYAVEENTIEYNLPAGTILSLAEIYKGIRIGETTAVSGQEYYRQKRYVDYYEAYYDDTNPLSLYNSFGFTIAQCRELIAQYQASILKYQNVLAAVKKHEYSSYEMNDYVYYLTKYSQVSTKTGDGYIADRRAFVSNFIALLAELSENNFIDVSTFTSDFTDYLIHTEEYKDSTGLASLQMDEWDVYYKNYYTLEGGVYVPVAEGADFDRTIRYYTYLVTTDYEYDCILSSILEQYVLFLEKFDEYKANRDTYVMQPKHLYLDSMNDINAAADYDYEGAGEMKYNFINWYLDSSYSTVFLDAYEDEYYLADDEAYLDSVSWSGMYSRYSIFTPGVGFSAAGSSYSSTQSYYLYDKDSFYAAAFASLCVSTWTSDYENFFTYNAALRRYEPATDTYDASATYYSKYKDVTTVISTRLAGGWEANKAKYYIKSGDTFVKVTGEYDAGQHYYASSAMYMSLVVSRDIVLYAKWMDISRGSEGLVYELVTDDTNGEKAFVVIDYVNNAESRAAGYYSTSEQYYYVTANDNGMIPEIIAQENEMIELQIPATISAYREATALAASVYAGGRWATEYSDFLVYNTVSFSYEPAGRTYNSNAVYYDKNSSVIYPVIGIRKNALDRYKTHINIVNLPLNLYFIEEGAFNLCPVENFTRAKPRTSETELDYVVLDINSDEKGIALYQQDAFDHVLISREGYIYSYPTANTLIAYAVANSSYVSYTVRVGTKVVGDYAFRNSVLTGIELPNTVQRIGKYAYNKAAITSFYVYASIVEIGEYAFSQCLSLSRVIAENEASLMFIGKDAFEGTAWFRNQKGIVKLTWLSGGAQTGAIIGFNVATGGGFANYDKTNDEYTVYDESGAVSATGNYYAITSGNDKIMFECTKNDSNQVTAVTLHGVIIGTKIVTIADYAFDVKLGFKEFFISAQNLRYIGNMAFKDCPLLDKITFDGATAGVDMGSGVFSGKGASSLTVVDASGLVRTGNNWSAYAEIIR